MSFSSTTSTYCEYTRLEFWWFICFVDNAEAKRTAFLGILQNDFPETWFVRIFRRKRRNDRLARLSARRIREEFAECHDNRRSLETLRNRKIRYPLSVVEIRGHAVNFLGGMTAQKENKRERRMENVVWCMGL